MENFKEKIKKYSGLKDQNYSMIKEELKREEAAGSDIKEVKDKVEAFAKKIDDLAEEGKQLSDEVSSYRTKAGNFAIKGTSKMMNSIAKLRSIYGDVRAVSMGSVAKGAEKWSQPED